MVLDLTGYICISRLAVSALLLWEIKEGSDRAPHSHSKHSIAGCLPIIPENIKEESEDFVSELVDYIQENNYG
ncbi:MAG: hypothetical protein O4861_02210 [Trichodesmium sp. St16_bin4-tuft]|nr:hypothetical protein [Trichodesmium sp. MAG_R01]MDE5070444.1 hypothetical protein [Trichodesmium sp. St5_bin8]MDE5078132.1 hypothetical protein [Trichodesmium sp. St2_bin6]MDE5097211.1 hypothetical protein [Trichodesmium sp. St16_bin4-tuft]MDE5102328.1 hypothetical protein [Trichodesmium sp. St19_bin2]